MSNYTNNESPSCINLSFIRSKVQESIDNGVDDDDASIKQLVRYYTTNVRTIDVEYMRMTRLYSVKFSVVEEDRTEYQYRFFVKSNRTR